MKRLVFFLLIVFSALLLTGCLTVEKKEYTFELKGNHSGTLTIKFINIMSMKDDTADISESDFNELISEYIEGNEIDKDYEDAIVRSKRLFVEDDVLCGEVIIDFEHLSQVGLFQYESKGPYMFNVGSFLDSETYIDSNGDFGGEVMPVVFWPKSENTLRLTTHITDPDETTVSLVKQYQAWK